VAVRRRLDPRRSRQERERWRAPAAPRGVAEHFVETSAPIQCPTRRQRHADAAGAAADLEHGVGGGHCACSTISPAVAHRCARTPAGRRAVPPRCAPQPPIRTRSPRSTPVIRRTRTTVSCRRIARRRAWSPPRRGVSDHRLHRQHRFALRIARRVVSRVPRSRSGSSGGMPEHRAMSLGHLGRDASHDLVVLSERARRPHSSPRVRRRTARVDPGGVGVRSCGCGCSRAPTMALVLTQSRPGPNLLDKLVHAPRE